MNRYFVVKHAWQDAEVELSVEESHHLLHVLRAKPEETVEIFDGQGRVAVAKLVSGRDNIARLAILPDSIQMIEPDPVSITLIQAVPKHPGLEEIIQKAVELGVQKIIPAITERVAVKFKDGNSNKAGPHSLVRPRVSVGRGCPALPTDKHAARRRKIALASAKQCHAAWLTEISAVVSLKDAANAAAADLAIFGSLAPETPSLKNVLGTISRSSVKNIALAIGPEGDFTDAEREMLLAARFKPAGFGNRVLRVETAAVFGLSALNYEFRTR